MGKILGIWVLDDEQDFDHVLVTQANFEILKMYMEESDWKPSQIYLLKSNVIQNESIFAWCVQKTILKDPSVAIHVGTHDTDAGRLINLLENFLSAFKRLDIEKCNSIVAVCSSMDFSKFYLYKTQWLLEQLTSFASAIRLTLIDKAPVAFSSINCKAWWDQPLEIKSTLESFRNSIDFERLKEVNSLQHLVYTFERIIRAAGEWGGYHNKSERHEPASGCLLALSKYWFLNNQLSLAILTAHRGIDLLLQFLALRDGLLIPTVQGLRYDDTQRDRASFFETFRRLNRVGRFTSSEANIILRLNDIRNHLREIHGFYVTNQTEVQQIMNGVEQLLRRLVSETKVWAIREKFDFAFDLDISIFFDVEVALDSYFEVL